MKDLPVIVAIGFCCAVGCSEGEGPGMRPAPHDGGTDAGGSGEAGEPVRRAGAFALATQVLAPLAGPQQRRAEGQESLKFYGTDLGYTFNQGDELRILFGDTLVLGSPLPPNDDAFGTLAFGVCPGGDEVERFIEDGLDDDDAPFWQRPGPALELATSAPDHLDYINVKRGDTSLLMSKLQTPTAAFTDGSGRAFAVFIRSEVARCDAGCPADVPCDSGLGTCTGLPFQVPCIPGIAEEEPGGCPQGGTCVEMGGYCRDVSTSVDDGGPVGRILASAQRLQVGAESPERRGEFQVTPWVTNKFANLTARTVRDFDEARAGGEGNDYRPVDAAGPQGGERVLLWGRPNYVGAKNRKRDVQLYLAVAEMPEVDAAGAPSWSPRYFAGLDDEGRPQLVPDQGDAVALDLSGGAGDAHEPIDLINQITVSWVEPLGRFVMIYGGDLDLEAARYYNPGSTRTLDGALQVRFAEQPWGPWSPPEPLLRGGDPERPELTSGQYFPGGILHHPECQGARCIAGDPPELGPTDLAPWGWLYGPHIVDCWTEARDDASGSVSSADLYWIASTWNPYQVVLLKTRVSPR